MKAIARTLAVSAAAAMLAYGSAYALEVQTPSEANEAGFEDIAAPSTLTGPVGATLAGDAGGIVGTGDAIGLVQSPDAGDDHPTDE